MAASYDDLEPWYEHLYDRLHRIVREVMPAGAGVRALDAGCGTGFQTAILAARGYAAHGVDVSAASLAVARARVPAATFARGDLRALPYGDEAFDAVVCAGSALDFVDDPGRALGEMGRVLRPGGRLLLEYERRWCPDLGWMIASSALGDALGYGLGPAAARRLLARPWGEGVWVDYPGYPRLRLFADGELHAMLRRAGFQRERAWGIHAVTNLLPSTLLHRPRLPRALALAYRALRAADALAGRLPAARAVAAHGVVLARKREGPEKAGPHT